jgi:hypothetical protein
MLRLINLLSASLLLFVIATTTTTSAQEFLPGYEENEKPENNLDDMSDCAINTNAIYEQAEILAEINRMNTEFVSKAMLNGCQTIAADVVCTLDYSEFESTLKELCEAANDGQYDEREHMIACQDATDPDAGLLVYQVENYPTCYATECEPAALERYISREVEDLEQSFSQTFGLTCDSNYEIEEDDDDEFDDMVGVNENGVSVSCPFRENATPETCGPIEGRAEGKLCDCYTFCNGALVGCDNQVQINTCPSGELVAGCTYSMFGMYDVQKSGSDVRAATSTAALLAFLLVVMPTVASFL